MEGIKYSQFIDLKEGDIIVLKNNKKYSFIEHKRVKFVATDLETNKPMVIPNDWFEDIIEKAPKNEINESYKTLKKGDLFCAKNGNKRETLIFIYEGFEKNRIIGRYPFFTEGTVKIDMSIYLGKVSEIKG